MQSLSLHHQLVGLITEAGITDEALLMATWLLLG